MELRQLRYLDRIVASGGFRKAARELGMTQPTLSAQMRLLERELGIQLLDRKMRPIRPTAAGELVLTHAHVLLGDLERLRGELAQLSQPKGQLTIGTHPCVAVILPTLLAAFADQYPNIDIRLQEGSRTETATLIERGDLDAGVVTLRLARERLADELHSLRLFSFEYVFAVPCSHRLADRTFVRLRDLADERVVLSSGTSGVMLKSALARAGISVHVAFETDDAATLTALVQHGQGIGFAPDYQLAEADSTLKALKVIDLSVTDDALLAWSGRRGRDPVLSAFVAFIGAQRLSSQRLATIDAPDA
jgi:DNA-binding transcriptional LysR family regulator